MRHPVCWRDQREKSRDAQRWTVTRRACRIFAPEFAFRRQEAAISGQTWVEQFEAATWSSSRSALASAAGSPASTFGAKPGKAITAAPRMKKIARAERDLTISGC